MKFTNEKIKAYSYTAKIILLLWSFTNVTQH